jgi:HD-like signal output (HDOD) protein
VKRILFVDDDSNALDAVGRLLRPLRNEWTLAFASGGPQAIAMLQQEAFDVVVTDMRMPVVDGKALLAHVHDKHPQVVRIVLSGQTELSSAVGVVPFAHQFLNKPCKPEDLKSAIERVGKVRDLLSSERIRGVIGAVDKLPSPPTVYARLTQALLRADVSIDEVTAIMESDPAMCAKLLHLVNSSFFGSGRRTTSVRDAISYLGTTMVRNLVTSVSVVDVLPTSRLPAGFCPERIGRECQLVAALARSIMKGNRMRADEAFSAGLLHEVGQLILAAHEPDLLEYVYSHATSLGEPLHVVEQQDYGLTHAEVGAYLLALWGLPWSIVEGVAGHHCAPALSSGTLDVLDAVYLANALVEEVMPARSDGASRTTSVGLDPAYLARLGVSAKLPEWQRVAHELAGSLNG